jgi:hypothetical protein
MKKILTFFLFACISFAGKAQEVINSKGTKVYIDSSKWAASENGVYLKNAVNVGIGTASPSAQLHTTGTVRLAGLGTNTNNVKILTTDDNGNVTTRLLSSLQSPAAIAHQLSTTGNTLASVVNGTEASATIINSVSNTSSGNTLSTSVNGITGSSVSLVKTNTLTQDGSNQLVSTVNGVAATALTVNTAGDVTGDLGATVVSKINGAPLGTTTGAATGQLLGWNGTAWVPVYDDQGAVFLSSNFTFNSTSATDSNLEFAIGANETYYVTIEGSVMRSGSSNGIKLAIGAPSGTTISGEAYLGASTLAALPVPSLISASNTLGNTFSTGNGVRVTFRMTFLVSTTDAGTIVLQAAENSNTSGTSTLYAGTRMVWSKATGL